MAEYEHIELHVKNRVGWLDYARPPINAMDWKMVRETHAGVQDHLKNADVRVIVIGSALGHFFRWRRHPRVRQDGPGGIGRLG